jgi:hypothetical protein
LATTRSPVSIYVLMAALLCLAAGLRLANLGNVSSRTPDERVYTKFANLWLESGAAGLETQVAAYQADAEARLYPTPTRVGMIRLIAGVMALSGRRDELPGASISCAASIASAFVLALLGLRFFPPWAAAAALLFFAVSPADLAIARRAWPDAMVELQGVLLAWIACEIACGSRRHVRTFIVLLAAVGSAGVTIKESTPLIYGLCGLWVLWVLVRERRDWWSAALLGVTAAAGLAIALLWMAGPVGGISKLVYIMSHVPANNAVNAYALEYASGPPWLLLYAFWIASPLAALFGTAGFGAAFAMGGERAVRWLAGLLGLHLMVGMATPHFLNLRYQSAVFCVFYLLAGFGFWYVLSLGLKWVDTSQRALVTILAVLIAIGASVADYLRFQAFFVRDSTADLSIKMLMDEQHR